jgi:hypothetical protein
MISIESNNPFVQINEIVTTGKLSKLEHFENDEKVMDKVVHDLDIFNYFCFLLKNRRGQAPCWLYIKKIEKICRKLKTKAQLQ